MGNKTMLTSLVTTLAGVIPIGVHFNVCQAEQNNGTIKGEYFLSQNGDPVCMPFTKNLNQFRDQDFDDCDSRLSEKFPEFSRPEWKEVPLDLGVAEKAFKGISLYLPKGWAGAERRWQKWLKETAELRASGKVKMWIANVDIDHDGYVDSIARVQYAIPASDYPIAKRGCVFSHSGLWRLTPSRERLTDGTPYFLTGRSSDVIYSSETNRHYLIEWEEGEVGPGLDGQSIGATREVVVSLARTAHSPPVPVCHINWVPTRK